MTTDDPEPTCPDCDGTDYDPDEDYCPHCDRCSDDCTCPHCLDSYVDEDEVT